MINEEKEIEVLEDEENRVVYKEMSPRQLITRRFFRSKLSVVGLALLAGLFLFSFLGPVVYSKWDEIEVDRSEGKTEVIEKKIEVKDKDGNLVFDTNGNQVYVYEIIEQIITENIYDSPSGNHILGTDEKGMDVFTRLMYGGRISLTIGFVVILLETLLGIFLGGLAGYFGKWVDQFIMRVVDVFNCIPTLPILLIASAVLDSWNIEPKLRIYYLMVILTIFGWSGTARMVRGQILFLREQEYMVATEVMGLPILRRIFKHLIPNVMPQLIVSMTLGLGSIILYESTLSFLGLGVPVPYAAWGTMISASNDPFILSNYVNLWLPAGLLIVLAVLGFNFVGDGLRDAMDPKSKR